MNKNLIIVLAITLPVILITLFYLSSSSNQTRYDTQLNTQNSETTESAVTKNSRYINYTPEAFNEASNKKRVYFFHANWCPTCKAANVIFNNNLDKIPEDVLLFKTDYDTNTELKNKYNITYQHTFVYVDANGNEIKKWNGGDISELIANIK